MKKHQREAPSSIVAVTSTAPREAPARSSTILDVLSDAIVVLQPVSGANASGEDWKMTRNRQSIASSPGMKDQYR